VINTVAINRTNSLPAGTGFINKSFVRIYVPLGSRLESAEGFDPVIVPDLPKGEYRQNENLKVWQQTLQQSLASGVWVGEESGKTFFGGWVITAGGETSKVSIRYSLPFALGNLDHYSLTVQKQAGSNDAKFSHTLALGPYHRLWSTTTYDEESSQSILFNGTLKQDLFNGFVIQK
jgi:hypothetical protein